MCTEALEAYDTGGSLCVSVCVCVFNYDFSEEAKT